MTKPLSAILFSLCLFAPGLFAANAEHILVVEIDGLSPESLNADDCPTLFEMARRGTVFRNHHGTFPASV
ncbi:MAG TPA: hypothetical protein PKI32_06375, partial [Opitutales bacterium]|nr:hypothetical protein [Opitutales bacterium]